MKKVLFVASLYGFLESFEINNMKILQKEGYEVHCIANDYDKVRGIYFRTPNLDSIGVIKHIINFARAPLSKENLLTLFELEKFIDHEGFDLIDCHTPIGGVIARLAARKLRNQNKLKVIYTAHGFHFYKGAPLKNWVLFYPIEKWLSRYTDVLITINKEDYNRAKNKFHANLVNYIPSVGIKPETFQLKDFQRDVKREQMGVGENGFLLLSIGELADRKNHEIIIKAICKLKNKKIFYFIAGEGKLRERYQKLIGDYNLSENIKLLGRRDDIPELCNIADVIVQPSRREGFGIASIEGMAAGLPLICSYVNGIKDYAKHMENAICCRNDNLDDFVNAIDLLYKDKQLRKRLGINAQKTIECFDIEIIKRKMLETYLDIINF